MRYVFVSLLLANIALVAWQQFQSGAPQEFERPVPGAPRIESDQTVYLLSERGSDRQRELERVVQSALLERDTNDTGCLAMGPFEDFFTGQDVVERLASLDLDPDLRAVDQPTGENDYRVMIPPASSLQNAFRKLRELQARDIDSYVITRGPDSLGISLGVFSTRSGALALRDSHRRSGYEAEISEIPRLDRKYWILSGQTTDLDIPAAVWDSLLEEHPGLEQRRMACFR